MQTNGGPVCLYGQYKCKCMAPHAVRIEEEVITSSAGDMGSEQQSEHDVKKKLFRPTLS